MTRASHSKLGDNATSLHTHIRLKLAALGQSLHSEGEDDRVLEVAQHLVESYKEKSRLLADHLPPADYRIQQFLERYLAPCEGVPVPRLPADTFVLDRPGLARHLSLPAHSDAFRNEYLASYRVRNGVLHNPRHDRRTTAGSFHVAEGGLPIPGDKKPVPAPVFARLLHAALNPPAELMRPPYTLHQPEPPELFVSLLLRPVVCPAIPGLEPEKRMEIRFFAPGGLVSNLDFVERIFGNGGDPNLPENDAGLDIDHWTGHTGCIVLAPHLTKLTKRELGLPRWDEASEAQRRHGLCWREPDERYNDGSAFKITARDASGVIVTLLGDNYFGYSKKEIKTQIGFAANLYGQAEEEHAGGALAFVRYNHGEDFGVDPRTRNLDWRFGEVLARYGERMEVQPEGHAIDKRFANLVYVPEDLCIDLHEQRISWQHQGSERHIRLQPGKVYMHPSGYKVAMERHPKAPSWRLVGTEAEGTFCHKPYTVSGGGKSEIAKSIEGTVIYESIYVQDLESDLDQVEELFRRDYSDALRPGADDAETERMSRHILSPLRSLGSVIRLFTPSTERYPEAYNAWLRTIPDHIRALVFIIKRFYRPEWGEDWRRHFSVDIINGQPGHELKFDGRKLQVGYLRVGFDGDGAWRVFKLRQDFVPAAKIQMEDDISTTVVVPRDRLLNCPPWNAQPAVKLATNCERYLFQRPDEAIHRGSDRLTEADLAGPDNFISNFQPLEPREVEQILSDVIHFEAYSPAMQAHIKAVHAHGDRYAVISSEPRRVDGKPTKNPRYLQIRDDARDPFPLYVAEMGARLHRRIPPEQPVTWPVDAILLGRRNNPPEAGHRPLCVFGPIHYQELPELFMDLIASLTGKSPSTTGAGSEGALTKGPFNALRTAADLNAALVGLILSGYPVYSSAAGHVGPRGRMDHDVSLLVPEIWARLPKEYRCPQRMLEQGMLEKVENFEYQGRTVLGSRLGYRITEKFVHSFCGRVFDSPNRVFDEALLRPETQDMAVFVDGIDNIVEAQRRVARQYLEDGSIEDLVPPLQALIHIMAEGHYQGKGADHPDIRALFTRAAMLKSGWYRRRLRAKQERDVDLWLAFVGNLTAFISRDTHADEIERLHIDARLQTARMRLQQAGTEIYLHALFGTLGAHPFS